ncbi:MAG: hypothetical protein Q8M91_11580 [Polaromonas sp.]|nr:hypothetical protein [Polaromonas sp.]
MLILAPALAVGVSALYFLRTKHQPFVERALVSAHGVVSASSFGFVWAMLSAKIDLEPFAFPILLLQLLVVASSAYAIHRAKVALIFHHLLLGIVPCSFWTLFLSSIAILGL